MAITTFPFLGVTKFKPITVSYSELDGSPTESLGSTGFKAVRKLRCAWTDRFSLTNSLIGGVERSGSTYIYYVPHRYAAFPAAYVQDVQLTPHGEISGGDIGGEGLYTETSYEGCEITVTYQTAPYAMGGEAEPSNASQAFVTESFDGSAEFITLPNKKFYWNNDQTEELLESESPGKLIKTITWNLAFQKVALPPASFINLWALVGKTNSEVIYSPMSGLSFGIGTLLLGPPRPRREVSTSGQGAWQIDLSLTYKAQGWNKFWKQGNINGTTNVIDPQVIYDENGAEVQIYEEASYAGFFATA